MSPKSKPPPPLKFPPPLFPLEAKTNRIIIKTTIKMNGKGLLDSFLEPLYFPFKTSKIASAPLSKPL